MTKFIITEMSINSYKAETVHHSIYSNEEEAKKDFVEICNDYGITPHFEDCDFLRGSAIRQYNHGEDGCFIITVEPYWT